MFNRCCDILCQSRKAQILCICTHTHIFFIVHIQDLFENVHILQVGPSKPGDLILKKTFIYLSCLSTSSFTNKNNYLMLEGCFHELFSVFPNWELQPLFKNLMKTITVWSSIINIYFGNFFSQAWQNREWLLAGADKK